jgi:heme/copper-type cytochrome/quinol oxidase subunit 3
VERGRQGEDVLDKGAIAVWAFIASETSFFVILILAYLYFNVGNGRPGTNLLEAGKAGISTALLVASSLAVWRSEKALARGDRTIATAWLVGTILLGIGFLVGQAREYLGLWHHGFTLSSDLFATTFFTLTGFHGLHVTAGVVALVIALGLLRTGDCNRERPMALRSIGLYWHFVDVVWLVVFSVVYLRPHL